MSFPGFILSGAILLASGNAMASSHELLSDDPEFFNQAANCVAVFKNHALGNAGETLPELRGQAKSGLTFALVGYNQGLRNPKAKALLDQAQLKVTSMTR